MRSDLTLHAQRRLLLCELPFLQACFASVLGFENARFVSCLLPKLSLKIKSKHFDLFGKITCPPNHHHDQPWVVPFPMRTLFSKPWFLNEQFWCHPALSKSCSTGKSPPVLNQGLALSRLGLFLTQVFCLRGQTHFC